MQTRYALIVLLFLALAGCGQFFTPYDAGTDPCLPSNQGKITAKDWKVNSEGKVVPASWWDGLLSPMCPGTVVDPIIIPSRHR
jgi:hypothetical protein